MQKSARLFEASCKLGGNLRSFGLFATLCIVLIAILLASIVVNYQNGRDLLGIQEFVLIGFLVFLVIGDEFVKFKASRDGIEIDNRRDKN